MKVYAVFFSEYIESIDADAGQTVLSIERIFSSKEKAEAFVGDSPYWVIEEWEVE